MVLNSCQVTERGQLSVSQEEASREIKTTSTLSDFLAFQTMRKLYLLLETPSLWGVIWFVEFFLIIIMLLIAQADKRCVVHFISAPILNVISVSL